MTEINAQIPNYQEREIPKSLKDLTQQELNELLEDMTKKILDCAANDDFVRIIYCHPDDAEDMQKFVDEIGQTVNPMIAKMIQVESNGGNEFMPRFLTQTMIEYDWLSKYYKDKGVFDKLASRNTPIMLTHKDLKTLFLTDLLLDMRESDARIVRPF